jgi:uncharacterized membrane protein
MPGLFHLSIALGLIALASGAALLLSAKKETGAVSWIAKIIAVVVILLSVGTLACTIHCESKCGHGSCKTEKASCDTKDDAKTDTSTAEAAKPAAATSETK